MTPHSHSLPLSRFSIWKNCLGKLVLSPNFLTFFRFFQTRGHELDGVSFSRKTNTQEVIKNTHSCYKMFERM